MEICIKAAAISVVGAIIGLVIKRANPGTSIVLSAAAAVIVLISALTTAEAVFDFVNEMTEMSGLSDDAVKAVLKTTAIAITARIASDICKDAGQTSAASAVDIAASLGALYAALPLMRSVVEMVGGLV